jgi:hypothetical protein
MWVDVNVTTLLLTLQPIRLSCQRKRRIVPGSGPRHRSRTAGTAKTRSCPIMPMLHTALRGTRPENVPRDSFESQPCLSRVRESVSSVADFI